jgi:hypothetical protein
MKEGEIPPPVRAGIASRTRRGISRESLVDYKDFGIFCRGSQR